MSEDETPEAVKTLERFLRQAGFSLKQDDRRAASAYREVLLENGNLAIRAIRDRGVWDIEASDLNGPSDWYDVAILRDLLDGSGDDELPLAVQARFIEERMPEISSAFDGASRTKSHDRLEALRSQRAKRRYPGLYRDRQ
jgi:hypothetical protein